MSDGRAMGEDGEMFMLCRLLSGEKIKNKADFEAGAESRDFGGGWSGGG